MTHICWLDLCDRLKTLEAHREQETGDILELIKFLKLLLIDLKPDPAVKHTENPYRDEHSF